MTRVKREAKIHIDDSAARRESIFAWRRSPRTCEPRRSPVSHDFAALSFYVGGESRVEQRAIWTIEAGDVLIVPAGEPHRLVEAQRPDFWSVGFCVPCLATLTSAALFEPFERVRDGASPVVRIPAHRRTFFTSLFDELSAMSPSTSAHVVRESLLTLIVSEVSRAAMWSSAIVSERSIVADALRYIERHCLGPLTLNEVAAAMHRTPSYITTALTRATGRSAVAWIIAGRMAEARRRLLHSDERVDVIAEQVGYADATHFIRLFRRVHSATPAAWRAMQPERDRNASGEREAGRQLDTEPVIHHPGRL
jgi:AraC-like DNA-binding protein